MFCIAEQTTLVRQWHPVPLSLLDAGNSCGYNVPYSFQRVVRSVPCLCVDTASPRQSVDKVMKLFHESYMVGISLLQCTILLQSVCIENGFVQEIDCQDSEL